MSRGRKPWHQLPAWSFAAVISIGFVAGCTSSLAELPRGGHVYREDLRTGNLTPFPNALVLVDRRIACPRRWIAEADSRTVDFFLLRTDDGGAFRLPARQVQIASDCKAFLNSKVASPFLRSEVGFVLRDPASSTHAQYAGIKDDDVVARDKDVDGARRASGQEELQAWMSEFNGSPEEYTRDMRKAIFQEMIPEICRVLKDSPSGSPAPFSFRSVALEALGQPSLPCN